MKDRPHNGRPRDIRTQKRIHAVREQIWRNPLRKQKIMSRDMKISERTMSRILEDDLHLGAYKYATSHLLTKKFKKTRHTWAKQLLQRFKNNAHEKILSVEESFNKQNDHIYAQSSKDARNKFPRVQWGHHPESVMIWWGISYNDVTPIHFCEKGVKTSGAVYRNTLDEVVKLLNETLYDGKHWVFQQDSPWTWSSCHPRLVGKKCPRLHSEGVTIWKSGFEPSGLQNLVIVGTDGLPKNTPEHGVPKARSREGSGRISNGEDTWINKWSATKTAPLYTS